MGDTEEFLEKQNIHHGHLTFMRYFLVFADMAIVVLLTSFLAQGIPQTGSSWSGLAIATLVVLLLRSLWCLLLIVVMAKRLWNKWKFYFMFNGLILLADVTAITLCACYSSGLITSAGTRAWATVVSGLQFVVLLGEARVISHLLFWRFRYALIYFVPTLVALPLLLSAFSFMVWVLSYEKVLPQYCHDEEVPNPDFDQGKLFLCIVKGLTQFLFGELALFSFCFNRALQTEAAIDIVRAAMVTMAVFFFALFVINSAAAIFRLPPIHPKDKDAKRYGDRNTLWLILYYSYPLLEFWGVTREVGGHMKRASSKVLRRSARSFASFRARSWSQVSDEHGDNNPPSRHEYEPIS